MIEYQPPSANSEIISIPDAYKIVWGAGSIALIQPTLNTEIKTVIGEEITEIFDRLDVIQSEAFIYTDVLPDNPMPHITMETLLQGVRNKINSIYSQHSAGHEGHINPFSIKDERLTAMMGLDLYIRASKNRLFES